MKLKDHIILTIMAILLMCGYAHAGCLTVKSPNGGEVLNLGFKHDITWTSTCPSGTKVKIILRKGSTRLGLIASGIPATDVKYNWTVGDYQGGTAPEGNDYKVVVKTMDNSHKDSSNNMFSMKKLYVSTDIQIKARMPVDLELMGIFSDTCPRGDVISDADSFYMNKVMVMLKKLKTAQKVDQFPELRIRISYFDMISHKTRTVSRDFKPGYNNVFELISTPVLAKRSVGIRIGVIPLGQYADPNMGNNTMVVKRCVAYNPMVEPYLDFIKKFFENQSGSN